MTSRFQRTAVDLAIGWRLLGGWRAASAVTGMLAAAAAPGRAQLTATVDAGASNVEYDEFLRSTAFTLTPSLRLERSGGTIVARGAYSRFEGGNQSTQGLVAASVITPAFWRLRAELLGSAGATHYNGLRASANLLAEARAHLVGRSSGGWMGVGGGAVATGIYYDRRDIIQGDAGGWVRKRSATLSVTLTPTRVGGSIGRQLDYTDAVAAAHWLVRRGEVNLSGGHRLGATGGGTRTWAEVGGIAWITRRVAFVGGAGAYPADLVQGLPGGRYAAVALRLASRAPRQFEPVARGNLRLPYEAGRRTSVDAGDARPFLLLDAGEGRTTIRLIVANARRVELMGDFTDWEPVELTLDEQQGAWTTSLRIPPGTHRVNIRVDGGPWIVPTGLASVPDDFGGRVGVLVVR